MAKTSQVLRDQRRKKLIAKHAAKRAELRAKLRDPNVSMEEKFQVQKHFAKLPRNSCPTRLKRRCEITGPVDRKMMINALNSGARVFMADFEDANSPTWTNVVDGQANCYDAVRRMD